MTYEIIKDNNTYQVDDLILFDKQPKVFRDVFDELAVNNLAEFDNATVIVFDSGRVIVTEKGGSDE